MSSAKKFGQSLLDAGEGAKMTKFDMQNAYKIVPCNMKDLRLQGFKWAGRFFVETTQPFRAIKAVSNYDIVGILYAPWPSQFVLSQEIWSTGKLTTCQ